MDDWATPRPFMPVLFCQQKLRVRGRSMSVDGTMNGESSGIGGRREAGKRGKELKSAKPRRTAATEALSVSRRYTRAGSDPLDAVTYEKRDSVISNPDG